MIYYNKYKKKTCPTKRKRRVKKLSRKAGQNTEKITVLIYLSEEKKE